MLHTKFHDNRPVGSGEGVCCCCSVRYLSAGGLRVRNHNMHNPCTWRKSFEGFYFIWALRPSWSCDLDRANKFSLPHSMGAPYEI